MRLLSAEIGSDLACVGGKFLGKGFSIYCQGLTVKGDAFFFSREEFGTTSISGTLNLDGAHFKKNLDFEDVVFKDKEQSIIAPDLRVGAKLKFAGGSFAGPISITNAVIVSDVETSDAKFDGGFQLSRSTIKGIFQWQGIAESVPILKLSHTKSKAFSFDKDSWEKTSDFDFEGFEYDRFEDIPHGVGTHFWQKEFLRKCRTHNKVFHPSTHLQLAKALYAMGHEEEARNIHINRRQWNLTSEWRRLRKGGGSGLEWLAVLWRFIAGFATDHGYRPGKAFLFMIVLGLFGTVFAQRAANIGLMAPTDPLIYKVQFLDDEQSQVYDICRENWTKVMCAPILPAEHSEFSSFAYSFDVLLPIINFRQQEDWAPRVVDERGNRLWSGWWMRNWEWLQTALGWLLSLLLVSGVTGIIRKD